METLIYRYTKEIKGVISCYDRIIITGTIPGICYAKGMTRYLNNKNIRIFDYPRFAEPYKEKIREQIQRISQEQGIEITFVRNNKARKEDIVKKIMRQPGRDKGIVSILSAMEACPTYKPWHNKKTGKTYLLGETGKCLHYYVYFIDEEYGYGYIRIPTWCPFRLQIYLNGHNILAKQLQKNSIGYKLLDNAFGEIEDFQRAQQLADDLNIDSLREFINKLADKYCPVYKDFSEEYHWSIMQAEYATDIVFKSKEFLQLIYEEIITTVIHTVKPEDIVRFLGQKLHGNYTGAIDSQYKVRIEGKKIKHSMGSVAVKMYDKLGFILRIETTTTDVSFFKHYRRVEHRDKSKSKQMASMKKNIYSLHPLSEQLLAANYRYLKFISAIEDKRVGIQNLKKLSQQVIENNRTFKGFNVFYSDDLFILETIIRGEFLIDGFRSKHLKKFLSFSTPSQISRILKRLRLHGLIKKIGNSYKYYITSFGRIVITAILKIKNLVLIPSLNFSVS